jgi:hypothetical protein
MVTTGGNITVEGFIADLSFVDRSKAINGILVDEGNTVASLTSKALSYFNKPSVFQDKRAPADRVINWTPTTSPQLIIDEQVFGTFVSTINGAPNNVSLGFFKLIDKLFFNYTSSESREVIEAFLVGDADIAAVYKPKSYKASGTIVADTVYLEAGTTRTIGVPAFITFEVTLKSGTTTIPFYVKLYTSVDAWINTYNSSTIAKVIPPLSYDTIFRASLINDTDKIFSTASTTAVLAYTTTQALLGAVSVSGIVEHKVVVTDGLYSVTIPFNIIYKGRPPTLFEIRNAIKAELLGSGVASEADWKRRIPSVFVTGRFYIVPLWDTIYQKPDQVVFPRIIPYSTYAEIADTILSSLGYGDTRMYMDVLSIYYNRMSAIAIPDMSGTIDIQHLAEVIPDYQDYAPTDAEFSYMLPNTKQFTQDMASVMAVDAGAKITDVYGPNTEGLLSFYSFTVESFEICVITKLCYTTIVGSTQ